MEIIKIPAINGLGKTKGTELAPNKISKKGEILELDNSNIEEQEKIIFEKVKQTKEKTVFIGGDHSISYPIAKAFLEKFKNLKLIILDAHPDLMPPMENPTHEEWLSAVISKGLNPKNILLIGARNIDLRERKYPIQTITISEINNSREKINEFSKDNPVHLSIDIDFFDAKIAPATGYPEKDGASKKQGLRLIKEIVKMTNLIGADIVEVNPTKTGAEKTVELAKEILKFFQNT